MLTLDEKQQAKADWFVERLTSRPADRSALWNLTGAVGSGKTTVLRRIADRLQLESLIPILITVPAGEIDAAPIALLETGNQLKNSGLLNGEMTVVSDPKRRWVEKMAVITDAVNRHHEEVVLLCDEPMFWYRLHESSVNDSPDDCSRKLAEWIANDAPCRRVMTGLLPSNRPVAAYAVAPRLEDGREFLASEDDWGDLGAGRLSCETPCRSHFLAGRSGK